MQQYYVVNVTLPYTIPVSVSDCSRHITEHFNAKLPKNITPYYRFYY